MTNAFWLWMATFFSAILTTLLVWLFTEISLLDISIGWLSCGFTAMMIGAILRDRANDKKLAAKAAKKGRYR
jgi:hypothetical protein